MFPVYVVINTITQMPYVGCILTPGKKPEERFKEHCQGSGAIYLTRAIAKYGKENFTVAQIDVAESPEQALDLEKWWIKQISAIDPFGYNLCPGGRGRDPSKPFVFDSEVLRKAGRKGGFARAQSCTRQQLSEIARKARLGQKTWNKGLTKASHPSLKKISEKSKAQRAREIASGKSSPLLGRKHSLEARIKMSLAKKGKRRSLEAGMNMFLEIQ